MQLLFANNAVSTLASALSSTATTISLATGSGTLYPNPTSGSQYFVMTLLDAATQTTHEIVWVTARSGDTLTVVRAQEGTAARAWAVGDFAKMLWTAGQAAASSSQGAGGNAGGVLTGTYPNPGLAAGAVATTNIQGGAVGTAELASNAVTNAILALMAASSIKGNLTNASADPVDIPLSSLLTALGFKTAGTFGMAVPGSTPGNIGSSGSISFGGYIINVCTIMLSDPGSGSDTGQTWTFATPFPTAPIGITSMNISLYAGYSGNSRLGLVDLQSISDSAAQVVAHNTQTGGTLVPVCLIAIGH